MYFITIFLVLRGSLHVLVKKNVVETANVRHAWLYKKIAVKLKILAKEHSVCIYSFNWSNILQKKNTF